jgi:hypothetical protein
MLFGRPYKVIIPAHGVVTHFYRRSYLIMPYIAKDPAHMGVTGEENHGHQSWTLLICDTGEGVAVRALHPDSKRILLCIEC